MSDISATIESVARDILDRIEVGYQVSVAAKDDVYTVNIATEESGILIGHHGKTLESLQILIGIITAKKLGSWVRVVVEVGDYRKRREEQLLQMAQDLAAKVAETGEPLSLPDLSPFERRVVHLSLSEHPAVTTESVGEGRLRTLMVKPKTAAKDAS